MSDERTLTEGLQAKSASRATIPMDLIVFDAAIGTAVRAFSRLANRDAYVVFAYSQLQHDADEPVGPSCMERLRLAEPGSPQPLHWRRVAAALQTRRERLPWGRPLVFVANSPHAARVADALKPEILIYFDDCVEGRPLDLSELTAMRKSQRTFIVSRARAEAARAREPWASDRIEPFDSSVLWERIQVTLRSGIGGLPLRLSGPATDEVSPHWKG